MSGMCVFILTRRTLAIGLPQNGRFMVYPSRVFPPRDVLSSLRMGQCQAPKPAGIDAFAPERGWVGVQVDPMPSFLNAPLYS